MKSLASVIGFLGGTIIAAEVFSATSSVGAGLIIGMIAAGVLGWLLEAIAGG